MRTKSTLLIGLVSCLIIALAPAYAQEDPSSVEDISREELISMIDSNIKLIDDQVAELDRQIQEEAAKPSQENEIPQDSIDQKETGSRSTGSSTWIYGLVIAMVVMAGSGAAYARHRKKKHSILPANDDAKEHLRKEIALLEEVMADVNKEKEGEARIRKLLEKRKELFKEDVILSAKLAGELKQQDEGMDALLKEIFDAGMFSWVNPKDETGIYRWAKENGVSSEGFSTQVRKFDSEHRLSKHKEAFKRLVDGYKKFLSGEYGR